MPKLQNNFAMNVTTKKQLRKILEYFTIKGIKASIERKKARKKNKVVPGAASNAKDKAISQYIEDQFKSATREYGRSQYYTPKSDQPISLEGLPAKLIAFYFPQYHPIPENDSWWGAGFTEWTNTAKAKPQFVGHYQPHIPGELGFYDLRLPETLHKQAELAKHYGIQGFCFHYYWFNGKNLLERPINIFLENKDIQIEFCFCWKNGSWTRSWEGKGQEVLMHQSHSPDDDIAFIREISQSFQDPRYIRINNKPILIIYHASSFPDIKGTITRWRKFISEAGHDGIFLISAESMDLINPNEYGFDAAVEFPPHQTNAQRTTNTLDIINAAFTGNAYDYTGLADSFGKKESTTYDLFKTVMPSWDNEPEQPGSGDCFINSSPQRYSDWLGNALDITSKNEPEKRLVFINAWNEWGKGAHLEPDLWNGYAYLHATSAQLMNRSDRAFLTEITNAHNQKFKPSSDSVIIYHSYYDSLIEEVIERRISLHQDIADAIISVRPDTTSETINTITRLLPNSLILVTDNRGRDVNPFIQALALAKKYSYRFFCKIHSKKSPHREDDKGEKMRQNIIASLLPSPSETANIVSRLRNDPKLSLLAPPRTLAKLSNPAYFSKNTAWLDILLRELGQESYIGNYNFQFPRGTMFWAKTEFFAPLLIEDTFSSSRFEDELGQLDGTFAHAIERIIGLIAIQNGGKMKELP